MGLSTTDILSHASHTIKLGICFCPGVGRSGLDDFDLTQVAIYLDDVCIIHAGEPAEDYTEEKGQEVMNQDEITIKVVLNRGQANDTVWTCDFSYDYVKINADYRS